MANRPHRLAASLCSSPEEALKAPLFTLSILLWEPRICTACFKGFYHICTRLQDVNPHPLPWSLSSSPPLLLSSPDDGALRIWKNFADQKNPEMVTAWQGLSDILPTTRGQPSASTHSKDPCSFSTTCLSPVILHCNTSCPYLSVPVTLSSQNGVWVKLYLFTNKNKDWKDLKADTEPFTSRERMWQHPVGCHKKQVSVLCEQTNTPFNVWHTVRSCHCEIWLALMQWNEKTSKVLPHCSDVFLSH